MKDKKVYVRHARTTTLLAVVFIVVNYVLGQMVYLSAIYALAAIVSCVISLIKKEEKMVECISYLIIATIILGITTGMLADQSYDYSYYYLRYRLS